jgi:hypothetical protein
MLSTGVDASTRRRFLKDTMAAARPLVGKAEGWSATDELRPLY